VNEAFFTPAGALRTPWRLGLFLVALVGWGIAFSFLHPLISRVAAPLGLDARLLTVGELLALLVATWTMLRWVDRRPWSYVAMGSAAARGRPLAIGAALGGVPILIPSLLLLAVGWLVVVPGDPGSWISAAAAVTAALLLAAMTEELLVRGYLLASLREALGDLPAVAVTSVVFGALHSWNPGAGARSIALVTLAGFFLGSILIVTGSLYAAWLAHAAWNWVQAVLLHAPVSGIVLAAPGYRTVDRGPSWATGGAWGPEGGLLAAVSMLVVTAYLVGRLRSRQEQLKCTTASR
jgi:uncharacterized protein